MCFEGKKIFAFPRAEVFFLHSIASRIQSQGKKKWEGENKKKYFLCEYSFFRWKENANFRESRSIGMSRVSRAEVEQAPPMDIVILRTRFWRVRDTN